MESQNDSAVGEREEILSVSMTRDELNRLYWAVGIGGLVLLGVFRKGVRHDHQIARLMGFASETAKYLEAKEAADAMFAKNILEHIITNKGA